MADELTQKERDALVRRAFERNGQRFPGPNAPALDPHEFHRLSDDFYLAVGDYFDRLPRRVMSACPYCGEALVRSFDPWGFDGLWWGLDAICTWDEPSPCDHFRVLLGATRLNEDELPTDMLMEVQPGPEPPFVVPRLLGLPNMIAVVGELKMLRGGPAYPIVYYSDTEIEPIQLHQEWRRNMLWFPKDGESQWTYANDPWDFELEPYVQADQLRWVLLDAGEDPPLVRKASDGETCPFIGLPGEREKQCLSGGARSFLPMPDGSVPWPFDD
ncbi:MAG: hypothetical protein DRI90_18475 [Deltaproteobacteria bacterium]|nr:MAG: hypothetical protein DRI90_18475 [Deltaproteobacteria bacterium]